MLQVITLENILEFLIINLAIGRQVFYFKQSLKVISFISSTLSKILSLETRGMSKDAAEAHLTAYGGNNCIG